ncbi:hypothetical protein KEJ18_00470 [Candidatus Bathyarchaeota archaeon]|nr:hypothetical protein [Candidatus Bathyarchaeota archaeon]
MQEEDVKKAVLGWLGAYFPTSIVRTENERIAVYEVEDGYSIGYRMAYNIHINCNTQLTECHKSLGQCLTCCIESGFVPTYLAVPQDYPHMEKLERIMSSVNLPIGLLTVGQNGNVRVAIKPRLP